MKTWAEWNLGGENVMEETLADPADVGEGGFSISWYRFHNKMRERTQVVGEEKSRWGNTLAEWNLGGEEPWRMETLADGIPTESADLDVCMHQSLSKA